MDMLKRILSPLAIGLLILTTGLGTTAFALAMDRDAGHCAEHMSMLAEANPTTNGTIDTSPHQIPSDYAGGEHDKCKVHMCLGLTILTPQISASMVHFDLIQARFKRDLHHVNQIEAPDRPPTS
ncbi:hypothetical protein [Parasedimentitalea psychrophila]|uniref:DUF2946 domain-containing protein n=1 Tax=Parasedimentitalea psychrophila TaxID=2997337 RepID=A0A9Y2KVT8_9RHOB|nr:hypothetical protein [Parasedimentitalea psychrophila]WIY24080.1 hypothetical protein QPJ95_15820 [Parasedimentitalea psychrophila]